MFRPSFAMAVLMCLSASAVAQRSPSSRAKDTDPQVAAVLKEVSAEQIRRNIEKLVSFGNRNTLSAAD